MGLQQYRVSSQADCRRAVVRVVGCCTEGNPSLACKQGGGVMTTHISNGEQLQKMKTHPGFIAALDQSGGSTPHALALYGIKDDSWADDDEMFDLVHQMRTRIITSPVFI